MIYSDLSSKTHWKFKFYSLHFQWMPLLTLFRILFPGYINSHPPAIYLFSVINGNTRTTSDICSKLIIKTQERRQWRHTLFCFFRYLWTDIFPSTFLQSVNGSKRNSISSYNFLFCFWNTLKRFSILFTYSSYSLPHKHA